MKEVLTIEYPYCTLSLLLHHPAPLLHDTNACQYTNSFPYTTIPLHHSQHTAAHDTQSHNRPPSPYNLLIRHRSSHIPRQMPQPIERVKRERKRQQVLGCDLGGDRPGRERRRHARALEVPAQRRRDQVGRAEDVETAAEHAARDAVERRGVPGDLGLVDAQVGSDGAGEALFGKDLGLRFGIGHALGRGESGGDGLGDRFGYAGGEGYYLFWEVILLVAIASGALIVRADGCRAATGGLLVLALHEHRV